MQEKVLLELELEQEEAIIYERLCAAQSRAVLNGVS